jgi:hypothetical protein
MHLIETIVLSIVTAFLNYGISEDVDEISKVEIVGGAIRGSTNNRHLAKP